MEKLKHLLLRETINVSMPSSVNGEEVYIEKIKRTTESRLIVMYACGCDIMVLNRKSFWNIYGQKNKNKKYEKT